MSTKTTFKRIALVAVAALGFGMLSVVPSNSATIAQTIAIDAAADTVAVNETATALITGSFITGVAYDSLNVSAVITSSNAGASSVRLSTYDSSTSTSGVYGATIGSAYNATSLTFGHTGDSVAANVAVNFRANLYLYNPTTAGTYTVRVYSTPKVAAGTGSTVDTTILTWTVTVTAADTTVTSGTSILRAYNSGNTTPWGGTAAATDSTVVQSKALTTVPRATIWTTQTNSAGTADESMTATISGPGFVTTGVAGTPGTAPTTGYAVTVKSGNPIYVWSNGTGGVATVTVKTVSGLTLGTETVNFYGAVTALAVTATYKTIGLAGAPIPSLEITNTTSAAFTVKATDVNGIAVPGLTGLEVVSSNGAVVTGGSVSATSAGSPSGSYYVAFTTATVSTSGQKATLTVRVADPASTTTPTAYLTVTKDVTVGGAADTETISFDKSSYSPGEGMIITAVCKDASGNACVDGYPSLTGLKANKALGGASSIALSTGFASGIYVGGTADSQTYYLGSVTTKFNHYAPAASGSFIVTGEDSNGVTITATGTVTDDAATAAASAASDAAAEATDAANAATDAANAAAEAADAATAAAQDAADAVAALSTQVASLISGLKAQLTSLTNLVIKIQKKVKA